MFKRFFEMTQDEFAMLQDSDIKDRMLSNKYVTDEADFIAYFEQHVMCTWLQVPNGDGSVLLYVNAPEGYMEQMHIDFLDDFESMGV
jgi:hypothetical protein